MKKKALKAAFPYTIPIGIGFLFLGMSYGFMMQSKGFSVWYPFFMSMFIFAGSMEFVTANLLLSAFSPIAAFFLALVVNARHLFYGLSMLDKYKNTEWKKFYLIFGMCDESFTVNCTVTPPDDKDHGRNNKLVVSKKQKADCRADQSGQCRTMIFCFFPLIQKHNDEQCSHDKFNHFYCSAPQMEKKYSAEYRRRNHPVYDTGTDCFPLERKGMSIIPHFDIPFLVILILQFR